MKKKLLAWFVTAAMLVGLCPAALAAEETVVSSDQPVNWVGGNTYKVPDSAAVAITQRVEVTGDVILDLGAGCELIVTGGIHVPDTASLTIQGTGALIADASGTDRIAGIGGNEDEAGGTITIEGGTVTANGGGFYGAGIGGGEGGNGGTIRISGSADVTATGGSSGAGIGGGSNGSGGNIAISGGTVTANGGNYAAGIGGGSSKSSGGNNGGIIEITGGSVTATGGRGGGAGIGGGGGGEGRNGSDGGTIHISGSVTVGATGGGGGAGIGGGGADNGGSGGSGGDITIDIRIGNVTANGSSTGAGIGGGGATSGDGANGGDGGNIKISNGTVTATGGISSSRGNRGGAGIGGGGGSYGSSGGNGGSGGTIEITGGTVIANGKNTGAGIGGGGGGYLNGAGGNGGSITISGSADVTATGGSTTTTGGAGIGGAGIGGGGADDDSNGGNGGTITISGGTVTATSGDPDNRTGGTGAGIGGGNGGNGGSITISGDDTVVTAASCLGAGIGGGQNGDGGSIAISGGNDTEVVAKSFWGAGIGSGQRSGSGGASADIIIEDGTVTATSYSGAGIGSGHHISRTGTEGNITVTISGGKVTATSSSGAGIGGGSGDTGCKGGAVTITGGTVNATGGHGSAGIGGGMDTFGSELNPDSGSFSTGTNGHAFIVASSIQDLSGQDTSWSGVIFNGTDGGKLYGSAIALEADATVPAGGTLTIGDGQSLLVSQGATMTNNGTITVQEGGRLNISEGKSLKVEPSANGTVTAVLDSSDNVTLTATVDEGYHFQMWQVTGVDSGYLGSAPATFPMPNARVGVTAFFESDTPPQPGAYTVTVESDGNGTASADRSSAAEGETVTLTATANSGYHFKEWQVLSGGVTVTGNSFVMPAGNVTVRAVFEADTTPPDPTAHTHVWDTAWTGDASGHWHRCTAAGCDITNYAACGEAGAAYAAHTPGGWIVDVQPTASTAGRQHRACTVCGYTTQIAAIPATGGGNTPDSGTPSDDDDDDTHSTYTPAIPQPSQGGGAPSIFPAHPERGDTVTVTPRPRDGYEVDRITVTDRSGRTVEVTRQPDGTYTFTQPGLRVEIGVTYRPVDRPWNNPFPDVREDAWYAGAVRFVQERGLMNGTGSGGFAPNNALSRAQLAQILYNKEGRPGVNYLLPFPDVADGAWYTEAIRWVASQGIVGGYESGAFAPNASLTREQLAVVLWRYAGSPAAAMDAALPTRTESAPMRWRPCAGPWRTASSAATPTGGSTPGERPPAATRRRC